MNQSSTGKTKAGSDGHVYFINGVKVPFPVKAYPQQITMMNKILKGLDKKQNCLLESPTGSGKTLSLLCSCLGWQRSEKEKMEAFQKAKNHQRYQRLMELLNDDKNDDESSTVVQEHNEIKKTDTVEKNSSCRVKEKITETDDSTTLSRFAGADDTQKSHVDDTDFQSAKKRFRTPNGQMQGLPNAKKAKKSNENKSKDEVVNDELKSPAQKPTWRMETNSNYPDKMLSLEEKFQSTEKGRILLPDDNSDDKFDLNEKMRAPRIFFGTRTHKQITQIVRELKKTEFKKTRMTILSSREHSCIHPEVSTGRDKNEECRRHVKGLDGKFCRFYGNAAMLSRLSCLERHKLDESWDIEDLVKVGKKAKACPYYGARELMVDADIIFCPYNYLVDPFIRNQMDINLKGEILVLDEAHNIEDCAREAASVSITSVQLEDVIAELDALIMIRFMVEEHMTLKELCSIVFNWLLSLSDSLDRTGFETSCKILAGKEMIERLRIIGITSSTFPKYKDVLSKINSSEYETEGMTGTDTPALSSKGMTVLRILVTALGNVLDNHAKFSEDFKIAISKKAGFARPASNTIGGWRNAGIGGAVKTWIYSLNFWCLNPAVVFSELGNTTRCIILTSGTLSPMSSFASELGVKFPIQLEANHVVPDSQVWVAALTVDTNNTSIKANYHTSETFTFQDEVGKAILHICEIVPRGVLCFFPSYSMLEKLKKRWQITDTWGKILNVKMIFSEPRGSDRTELETVLEGFYTAANDESMAGALLLAVCRGKVSEGLDFSDNNARAVITIGIPFPDFKDKQVELKRDYNNKHSNSRGLLKGSEWYEIQAYRALNQALGRCIRHRRDWGAILLIDERFGLRKYKEGLSRWVRSKCRTFEDFASCLSSLKLFANARIVNPCPDDDSRRTEPQSHSSSSTVTTISVTDEHSAVDSKAGKMHSTRGRVETKQNNGSHGNSSVVNCPESMAVRPYANGTPSVKKERIVPKQLSSQMAKIKETDVPEHQVHGQKAINGNTNNVKIDVTCNKMGALACNRMKLFKTSQPKLSTSSDKTCEDKVVKSGDKTSSRNVDIIEIEDDEIVDEFCGKDSKVENRFDDSVESRNVSGKQHINRAPIRKESSTGGSDVESENCKTDTPLLFSDNAPEIGSVEDSFWESTESESDELVVENVAIRKRQKSGCILAAKEENTNTSSERKGMQKVDNADVVKSIQKLHKHAKVKNGRIELETYTDINNKNEIYVKDSGLEVEWRNGGKGDGDFAGLVKNNEPSFNVKRKKSKAKANIRMAAKNNHSIDCEAIDLYKKTTVKCSHCLTHFATQADFVSKKIDASSLSEVVNYPGEVLDVIELAFSSLRKCDSIKHLCSCTSMINDVKLNAVFSEENGFVYIPLFCVNCRVKSQKQNAVGFRIIDARSATCSSKGQTVEKDKVLLLPDEVVLEDKK